MNWTKEFPKVEGVYYYRRNNRPPCMTQIDECHLGHMESTFLSGTEFLGPITPQLVERALRLDVATPDIVKTINLLDKAGLAEQVPNGLPDMVERLLARAALVEEYEKALSQGICVYCGKVEQYESLEQKMSAEGNAMRVAHIRQCAERPELKLIALVEELVGWVNKVSFSHCLWSDDRTQDCENCIAARQLLARVKETK